MPDDCLDLFAQELGLVLKSEHGEALESLLRGKDVFVSYQQALAIFNCNDDPYSVGVFSFSIIGKSIMAQFQTFVVYCGERFSFIKDDERFVFQKVSQFENV